MSVSNDIFSEEVESAFLSTVFYNGSNAEVIELIQKTPAKLFYKAEHRLILKAIKNLKPEHLNFINVVLSVRKEVPDWKVLEILKPEKSSLSSLHQYTAYLKSLMFRRYAYTLSLEIQKAAVNDDPYAIFSNTKAISKLYDILTRRNGEVDFFKKALEEHRNSFIQTVFDKFNSEIGGFSRREISSIGGKSGHQKTAWCIFNATESIKRGIVDKVHYISIEHPGDIIACRVLAKDMEIPYRNIIDGTAIFNKTEAYSYLKKTYGNKLIITDDAFTLKQIIDSAKSVKVDQHIVDHAQEVHYPNNDMINGISELLLELKAVARSQNANVLLLSQVRDKEINDRLERMLPVSAQPPLSQLIPKSHDFYNSSRIKQESRQQLVIYWQYQDLFELEYQDILDYFDKIKIICYKSTYSGTSRINLTVRPDVGIFN